MYYNAWVFLRVLNKGSYLPQKLSYSRKYLNYKCALVQYIPLWTLSPRRAAPRLVAFERFAPMDSPSAHPSLLLSLRALPCGSSSSGGATGKIMGGPGKKQHTNFVLRQTTSLDIRHNSFVWLEINNSYTYNCITLKQKLYQKMPTEARP
jgi:hypothetical protein